MDGVEDLAGDRGARGPGLRGVHRSFQGSPELPDFTSVAAPCRDHARGDDPGLARRFMCLPCDPGARAEEARLRLGAPCGRAALRQRSYADLRRGHPVAPLRDFPPGAVRQRARARLCARHLRCPRSCGLGRRQLPSLLHDALRAWTGRRLGVTDGCPVGSVNRRFRRAQQAPGPASRLAGSALLDPSARRVCYVLPDGSDEHRSRQ
jgi:hypothetical protein